MTIRSLGYLKLLIQNMLVSVDAPKHQVLCCTGRAHHHISKEENILGLAYSKSELQSVEALNVEADPYMKLKAYHPLLSINPTWKMESTREVVTDLHRRIRQVKGGAEEREDQPMMFLPGRVLHLEETKNYGRGR